MEKQNPIQTTDMNSHSIQQLEGDVFAMQEIDLGQPSEESESHRIDSGCIPNLDGGRDRLSDEISDARDTKSEANEVIQKIQARQDDLIEHRNGDGNLQSLVQQETLDKNSAHDDSDQKSDEGRPELYKDRDDLSIEQVCSGEKTYQSRSLESKDKEEILDNDGKQNGLIKQISESGNVESMKENEKTDVFLAHDNRLGPVSDGKEVPGMEAGKSTASRSLDVDVDQGNQGVLDKTLALKNFVRAKSVVAISSFLRRLAGKGDDFGEGISKDEVKEASGPFSDRECKDTSEKTGDNSSWSPLNLIKMSSDADVENKADHKGSMTEGPPQPLVMRGRIMLYTRLGCKECKEARLLLHWKRLRYVEINIDIYQSRKLELEKISGSSDVPKVFFNEILIGGLNELISLNDSGKLNEKIDYLITEAPSFEAPLPPLSGEDDASSSGALDEWALIVRKMKESIVVKDRFYKMRRFINCFMGSEAVDFLSEDQYLERQEAIEFGRKLGSKLFFQHVLEENLFEDGNHLYRFLDDDPIVATECHNIPRGITCAKPKPIIEIASRLRLLSRAIFEAYASEDGLHVDYRNIHGSEEFARYLRIIEELQRVELQDMPREEKLAFFINLSNMMAIHAILVWGHPAGPLERRKMFGDFKYIIGGSTYSLSSIQSGILRGNQRPPYNLMKPFGAKDRRFKVALPYAEPLIHFALVYGTRSGPALRFYSPANVDQELMEAARRFLRNGGLIIDLNAMVVYASKILKWYSVDFGKNEVEVLKHMSNYLHPDDATTLLDLLATSQLKENIEKYWRLLI